MDEVLPGILMFPYYSIDKGYYFNGYYLKDGAVLIDPPSMDNYELMEMVKHGKPKIILLTNKDHVRQTEFYRQYFKCKVWMNERDASLVSIKVDKTFKEGDKLPGGLIAVAVPDNKSPGETALFLEKQKAMILGDALIGVPAGELNLMPPAKYADPVKAKEGIRILLKYAFNHVLVCDGTPVLHKGREAVEAFLNKLEKKNTTQ